LPGKLTEVVVRRLSDLLVHELQPLLEESLAQDLKFVERLVNDYASGSNRFDQAGEAVFGVYAGGQLVAIGGLNRDPYLPGADTGRARHVYVLAAWRRRGVGRQLMQAIIDAARSHFRLLTLRTVNPEADAFYRAIGFCTEPAIDGATHHMTLQ
jgi:hypothetical protein